MTTQNKINDAAATWPWSVEQQRVPDGRVLTYFKYKSHTIGQFSGSIENAEWMVLCINAAHACYIPMADGVAQEAGFADSAALWASHTFDQGAAS